MAKKKKKEEELPNEVVEDEAEEIGETEEVIENEIVEVETEEPEETKEKEVQKVEKIEFRTQEGKNFSGFLHPKNRKLVTVDKDGKIFVDESDQQAIDILTRAADIFRV